MSDYVVYHNCEGMGYSLSDRKEGFTGRLPFRILTAKDTSRLVGHTVWLVEGSHKKIRKGKTYYLCARFVAEKAWADDDYQYAGAKSGNDYRQKFCLNDYEPWFSAFRGRMANFSLGLQKISDEDVAKLRAITHDRSGRIAVSDSVKQGVVDAEFTAHDRLSDLKVRQGQNIFSDRVKVRYGNMCLVCGISETELLIGAHIVRWADDKSNRLNPANGLCLCSLHDRAFEHGLFTLDRKLRICVSNDVSSDSVFGKQLWKLQGKLIRLGTAQPPGERFLAEHRKRWSRNGAAKGRRGALTAPS